MYVVLDDSVYNGLDDRVYVVLDDSVYNGLDDRVYGGKYNGIQWLYTMRYNGNIQWDIQWDTMVIYNENIQWDTMGIYNGYIQWDTMVIYNGNIQWDTMGYTRDVKHNRFLIILLISRLGIIQYRWYNSM